MEEYRSRKSGARVALAFLLLGSSVLLWRSCSREDGGDWIPWKAEACGRDLERILRYVREECAPDDYEGSLRGPIGVLWAGRGNDLDRAWLLKELLAASGFEVRLAGRDGAWWVQLSEGGRWRDLRLDPHGGGGPPQWTGGEPPAELRHRLAIRLLAGSSEKARKESRCLVDSAALSHHPLVLRRAGDQVRLLAVPSMEPLASVPVSGSAGDRLELRFEVLGPGGVVQGRYRRLIWSGEYEGRPKLDDPRDAHLLFFTTGRLLPGIAERERSLLQEKDHGLRPMERRAWSRALSHVEESDRLSSELARLCEVSVSFREPRLILASTFHLREKGVAGEALDLRRNRIHAEGEKERTFAFHTLRSVLEMQLEDRTIRGLTGDPVLSAAAVLERALEIAPFPSVLSRLDLYRSALSALSAGKGFGSRLDIAEGKEAVLSFRRGEEGLVLEPAASLREVMEKSGREWPLLSRGRCRSEDLEALAFEVEALLGAARGVPTTYIPRIEWGSDAEDFKVPGHRIFSYRKRKGKEVLNGELEILEPGVPDKDGKPRPLVYDNVDYWDDVNRRPYRFAARFVIPPKTLEDSHVFSYWYDQSRYNGGESHIMLSRSVYAELKSKGRTILRYSDKYRNLSEPLELFLVGTEMLEVRVDDRMLRLPFLKIAGTWERAKAGKPDAYSEVESIPAPTHPAEKKPPINKFTVLDDPIYPLISVQNAVFQSSWKGVVRNLASGLPVKGAGIRMENGGLETRSGADGWFSFPIAKKPIGRFRFEVKAPGFEAFSREVDLSVKGSLPLRFSLKPLPAGWMILNRKSAAGGPKGIADPRVRDLIAEGFTDAPDSVVVLPGKPVPFGLGETIAWIRIDPKSGAFDAVTEDGLYGVGGAWYWLNRGGRGEWFRKLSGFSPTKLHGPVVQSFAGYIASWYAYSAGKLDALAKHLGKGLPGDLGHAHAIRFALRFLQGMKPVMTSLVVGVGYGTDWESYRAGFLEGLRFFEKNPVFKGGK